ncbi:putative sulfate exporter family transporter [Sphingomonas sp. RB56-2]|uniref:Sulfate exporter family transporter n=1 Tax=Sphingomonas brevis TaxID=2908206 RepID=A0ABT0S9N9_9SPHN|nr:putative sulfate exporter family transporter [Sphingomonas brevis]MCL6741057.1 putative sulfate exporter family transporter [Sphingomonas brevis]
MTKISGLPLPGIGGVGPGVLASLIIAAAATFLADHYGGPVMLFALLLGMAMNFLSEVDRCKPGISFASRTVLRLGVALLGFRITLGQIADLGWQPVALVVAVVALTILASTWAARAMGFKTEFGILSGGATAICGASAAMALSASLPAHPLKERATGFTIIGVSTLSTIAMILYPAIAKLFGFDDHHAGLLIGATIHDVAQVVGAGYAISPEAGDTATVVKLMRVAMLLPVIVAVGLWARSRGDRGEGKRPPLLPWFVTAFVALVVANTILPMPGFVRDAGNEASRWCLVAAIAALGIKTHFSEIVDIGWKPVVLMVLETVFIAVLALAALWCGWL